MPFDPAALSQLPLPNPHGLSRHTISYLGDGIHSGMVTLLLQIFTQFPFKLGMHFPAKRMLCIIVCRQLTILKNVKRMDLVGDQACFIFPIQVMGHMDVVSIVSDYFNIYFPIALIALTGATYFSLGARLLSGKKLPRIMCYWIRGVRKTGLD